MVGNIQFGQQQGWNYVYNYHPKCECHECTQARRSPLEISLQQLQKPRLDQFEEFLQKFIDALKEGLEKQEIVIYRKDNK